MKWPVWQEPEKGYWRVIPTCLAGEPAAAGRNSWNQQLPTRRRVSRLPIRMVDSSPRRRRVNPLLSKDRLRCSACHPRTPLPCCIEEKIPRDNSNDFKPMWVGDSVYFLSDRHGPVALFAYDTRSKLGADWWGTIPTRAISSTAALPGRRIWLSIIPTARGRGEPRRPAGHRGGIGSESAAPGTRPAAQESGGGRDGFA